MRYSGGVALALAWLVPALPASQEPAAERGGVVVTRVEAGYEAARAGLRAGDVLLSWRQGEESGSLESPLGVDLVQTDRAAAGELRLIGRRNEQAFEVSVVSDEWALETEPRLAPELEALRGAVAGLQRRSKDPQRDAPFLREAAQQVPLSAPLDVQLWLLGEISRGQVYVGRMDDAKATLAEARRRAHDAGEARLEAAVWSMQVDRLWSAGRAREAQAAQREGLALDRARGPLDLAAAGALMNLAGLALARQEDLAAGRAAAEEAVALCERLAPRSSRLARALERLAEFPLSAAERTASLERALTVRELGPESLALVNVLLGLGKLVSLSDPQRWVALSRRAAGLEERFEPDTLNHATTLSMLSASLLYLGDVDEAESVERRSFAIRERLAPDSPHVADSLDRLGSIALIRGDLLEAEALCRRGLAIAERATPGTVVLAKKLQTIGQLARTMGDLDGAASYLKQALAVFELAGDDGLLATCLTILGDVAAEDGTGAAAEAYYQRALEIARGMGPDAPLLSIIQQNYGLFLVAQGKLDEAEALDQEALARDLRVGDRGRGRAGRHYALGSLRLRRGDLDGAEQHLQAALGLYETIAPGSWEEADACQSLGTIAKRRGRREEAVAWLRRAVDALESQSRRLVRSPELGARFRARHADVYRELEELLLELERPDEAFHVTERARARALLAHLAERRWRAGGSVSPELEREKRMADAEYDRAYAELGAAEDDEPRAELKRRLDAARRRQDDVRGRIRAAAPRLAPFQDPVPDDLAAVRRGLDPGTLLLSYRIGPEASRVYAVGPGEQEFAVFELHAGEAAVRGDVRAFRQSLDARRGPWLQAGLFEQSRRLAQLLLGPVADRVARAERLLILPDGVLYLLPFAALADPGSAAARRFLVESKPLHVASSATLYEQLARGSRRPPSGPLEVVGFGDPAYAAGGAPRPALRPAVRDGLRLAPLPFSRRELSALRELSPGGATLWLGSEATETRAKLVGENARIVHFACHGFVDERFPLESGLALSTPGEPKAGDNGLLQAWEVFEGVHIDADLVTLSACRTGLGEELAGEGLLGLAWAFEYAGARSVLASLWEVDDASTAVLMRSFYRALRAGAPKAEALRRAQLELLRRSPTAAPYFWAAFQLIGDGH